MSVPQKPAVQRHAGKITAATIAAALALATPFVMRHEGAGGRVGYRDIVGVVTSCYGHTGAGAQVGRRYSADECRQQLQGDIGVHLNGVLACISVDVPADSLAAFVSFAFNVGVRSFCTSSVARDLNAGHLAQACADLDRWVYAGGRRIPGLVKRRADERALCEKGIR